MKIINSTLFPLPCLVPLFLFFTGISCNRILKRRITSLPITQINTILVGQLPKEVPHPAEHQLDFTPRILKLADRPPKDYNSIFLDGTDVVLPLVLDPGIPQVEQQVEEFVRFTLNEGDIIDANEKITRKLRLEEGLDEDEVAKDFYYKLFKDTLKYNDQLFEVLCPSKLIKDNAGEASRPNWQILLEDFIRSWCEFRGKPFTLAGHHPNAGAISDRTQIQVRVPATSPLTSFSDYFIQRSAEFITKKGSPLKSPMDVFNETTKDAPFDSQVLAEQHLADVVITFFTTYNIPTGGAPPKTLSTTPAAFLSLLEGAFTIDNCQVKSGHTYSTKFKDRLKAKFQIGEFVRLDRLPLLVAYGLIKNMQMFFEFSSSKSWNTIKDLTDYIAGGDHTEYKKYLSDFANKSSNEKAIHVRIPIVKFNEMLQKRLKYSKKRTSIPDFTPYLEKHPFCQHGVTFSIPMLAYDSKAVDISEEFSIVQFIKESCSYNRKSFSKSANVSIKSKSMNNGRFYIQSIIDTIFSPTEITRYNEKIGWIDPSFQVFSQAEQVNPFSVIEIVLEDEKKEALKEINENAMQFFDHPVPSAKTGTTTKLPSILNFTLKDFEVMDKKRGMKIFKFKFFIAIARTNNIKLYIQALLPSLPPSTSSIEDLVGAKDARNKLTKDQSDAALKAYKETIIKLFNYDETSTARFSQIETEFKKTLQEYSAPFSWDLFFISVLSCLLVGIGITVLTRFILKEKQRIKGWKGGEQEPPVIELK